MGNTLGAELHRSYLFIAFFYDTVTADVTLGSHNHGYFII